MSSAEETQRAARLAVENVGGIDSTQVELPHGVTVLAGRNATNRTSLLRSIMGALGSDDVSLKADADEGRAELTIGGETYTRTLERTNGAVSMGGDLYLDDPETANLFAFLLGSNEARQAVAREQDPREIIMRPVDIDELQAEIRRLETEKRELDAEIDQLERLSEELPDLEVERSRLEGEMEATREELAELETEIEQHGADVETGRDEQNQLESKLEELRKARNEMEELRYDVETQERSLEALADEREQLLDEREDYPESVDEVDDLQNEIDRLRAQRDEVEATINELGTIVRFNEGMLNDGDVAMREALGEADEGTVADQLAPGESVVCWTCGSDVGSDQIEATVEKLRNLRREKRQKQRSLDEEIDELEAERIEYEEKRRQRRQIERRLDEIEREIDERERRLEELNDRRGQQVERVETLEEEVESLETDEYSDLLELHREANQREFELGRLQSQLDGVEEEIESVESQVDELDAHRERREAVDEKLAELRNRIRRIETEAVEAFNDHMEALLDLLDYDNLERIWIERVGASGSGPDTTASFDLHVVRATEDGATYEDTIDHLSESEREVTGLVFALAGYLVHDLSEEVPFMVLDSLEAIDSDRIAELVEYFADYAEYLVVALLPEDAAALDEEYPRIADI